MKILEQTMKYSPKGMILQIFIIVFINFVVLITQLLMEQHLLNHQKPKHQNLLILEPIETNQLQAPSQKTLKEKEMEKLRMFLSSYVTDMAFEGVEAASDDQEQAQQITLDDWNKIQKLQFSKFDYHLSRIISQSMTNLRNLQLNSCGIQEQGTKIICKWFPKLVQFDLSGNSIRQAGGLEIANSMSGLVKLNIEDNRVGDLAIITISQKLKKLQQANFGNNKIGNLGAAKIAANLKKLKYLNIGWNNITTIGGEKLASLKNLTYINVKTNWLETKGIITLGRKLNKMVFFRIGNNRLGDFGAQLVCNQIPKLQGLGLWDSYITSDSLDSIRKLHRLKWLTIAHNRLSEQDVFNLCQSLPYLRFCDASKIEISEQARITLQQAHPECVFDFSQVA